MKHITLILTVLPFLLSGTVVSEEQPIDTSGHSTVHRTIQQGKIDTLISLFSDYVFSKNASGLRSLVLSENTAMFGIDKQSGGPVITQAFPASEFIRSVTEMEGTNRLQITGRNIEVSGNSAYSFARYDQLFNGADAGFGYDLFTFVRRNDEWKIAVMNWTTNPGPVTERAFVPSNTPTDVLMQFSDSLNRRRTYSSLVTGDASGTYVLHPKADSLTRSVSTVGAFRKNILPSVSSFSVQNVRSRIWDDYMATVESDYSITIKGISFSGKMTGTLLATKNKQWRFTSIMFG